MLALSWKASELSSRNTTIRLRPFSVSQLAVRSQVEVPRRPVPTRPPTSNPGPVKELRKIPPIPCKSSSWPVFFVVGVIFTAGILLDRHLRNPDQVRTSPSAPPPPPPHTSTKHPALYISSSAHPRTPAYSDMNIPPGYLGNLTPEQELKLQELWSLTLRTFGVKDPGLASAGSGLGVAVTSTSEPSNDSESIPKSLKTNSGGKKRYTLFSRKKQQDDNNGVDANAIASAAAMAEGDDKYGQTREFQQTLKEMSAEELRSTFWSMVKADHPDALLLRFLRARKWDVQRALVMLVSTMRWRSKEIHVDDDIMQFGEGGALADSKGGDSFAKKEGEDFLAQVRKGKSFLHGADKEGRPLCLVRARLHRQGEHSERAMERYTVLLFETARLVLRPPVETATVLFDMTSFTLANMDYAPVKFIIKIFEANYPESLGVVLVHKAPWVFQGIWSIIKGWLDPVVAGKVHFTKSVGELERFIPRSQIVRELGGDEDWEFRYVEPVEGENELMKDLPRRRELEEQRNDLVVQYQDKTFAWIGGATNAGPDLARERDRLAERLYENYWALDPFIRARSLYDRQGVIGKGGVIDFYPDRRKTASQEAPAVNGSIPATATTASSKQIVGDRSASEDVD